MFVSELRQRILDLGASGRPVSEISSELGVACNTVRYHLARGKVDAQPPMARAEAKPGPAVATVLTRARVAELLGAGLSRQVARRLGVAKSTVTYHARRLGRPIDARGARRYDWATIQRYYDTGASVRDYVEAFGFSKQSWHAAVRRGEIVSRPAAMPISELLVAGTYRGREHVKRRLLADGLKLACCERCGLVDWLGGAISLSLHHRNGQRHDNRLENLELLCPNCHSQTDTFAGRNRNGRAPATGAVTRSAQGKA